MTAVEIRRGKAGAWAALQGLLTTRWGRQWALRQRAAVGAVELEKGDRRP